MPDLGELRIEHRHQAKQHVIALAGELDMLTAPRLRAATEATRRDGADRVVVDLREVAFMDSSGLRVLLAALDECRSDGCEFFVALGDSPCRTLLEITGAIDELPQLAQP